MNRRKEKNKDDRRVGSERVPIGQVTRREYLDAKKKVMEFEKTNRKFVALIPCEGNSDWCEMGENSALIYKYKVCLELGQPANLTDDLDNHHLRFPLGRVRTRGYERVRRLLKSSGIYKSEVVRNRCMFFEINPPLSEDEIRDLRNKEIMAQEKANKIVEVNYTDPALYQRMLNFGVMLHSSCLNKLDKLSRDTNGRRMVELLDIMMREYFEVVTLTMTKVERAEMWQKMYMDAHLLLGEMQVAAGLRLWSREKCVNFGEEIVAIKERIKKNLEDGGRESQKEKS